MSWRNSLKHGGFHVSKLIVVRVTIMEKYMGDFTKHKKKNLHTIRGSEEIMQVHRGYG